MYHNIGVANGFNTVSLKNFKEQLTFIKSNFNVVSLMEYIQQLDEHNNAEHLTITFDDGYVSYRQLALPELSKNDMPSTVYIPVNYIGKTNTWDDGKIKIMNEQEIHDVLKDPLVTPGGHSLSHRRLKTLAPAEINDEIYHCKLILEQTFLRKVEHFSYPYGQKKDYNQYCIKALGTSGYISAVSTNYSRRNSTKNIFELNRIEIEPADDIRTFRKKLKKDLHPKLLKQRIKNFLFK